MKKFLKLSIIIFLILIPTNIKAKEIPKVFLNGNINNMSTKTDERKIELHYKSNDLEFKSHIKIKIQGNSIEFYDSYYHNGTDTIIINLSLIPTKIIGYKYN